MYLFEVVFSVFLVTAVIILKVNNTRVAQYNSYKSYLMFY